MLTYQRENSPPIPSSAASARWGAIDRGQGHTAAKAGHQPVADRHQSESGNDGGNDPDQPLLALHPWWSGHGYASPRRALPSTIAVKPRPRRKFIEPYLPSSADNPPFGSNWIHEIKHDGYGLMARRDPVGLGLIARM